MKLDFIKEQIEWVNKWTSNLITDITDDDCGVIENLSTSINWQIGHIIVSNYFHCVKSVLEKDSKLLEEINQKLPVDDFFKYYFAGSDPKTIWKARPNKSQLMEYKNVVDMATESILKTLSEDSLEEKTEIGNPIAKTKYDALTFAFKHQMWHNGQIAMMKRIIG